MRAARTDPRAIAGLYAVTPDLADTRALVARVAAAIDGGARAIQYRNKTAGDDLCAEQADALVRACRGRALLVVNDDAALAARVHADGVHVGDDDGGVGAARALVGDAAIVGVSCYGDPARARAAAAEGADYVAFGSFFASRVKPGARRADLAVLRDAATLRVPVVAIGGITAANAGALFEAGADAVAVISDVFDRASLADVTHAARALDDVWRASQRDDAQRASHRKHIAMRQPG